jgi:hypothetical protein
MNKGILVLEDGRVISGRTDLTYNAFGEVALLDTKAVLNEGTFTADCPISTDQCTLVGKIVVDSLPIEYHMYDVKNTILI